MKKHIAKRTLILTLFLFVCGEPSTAGDRPNLEYALQAARWIRSTKIVKPHGVVWAADPNDTTSIQTNLYSGSAGVVLFLLEIYHTTGDSTYLADARSGADYLLSALSDSNELQMLDDGLYSGLAGLGFTLEEAFKATGEQKYRDGFRQSLEMIRKHAVAAGSGVEWQYHQNVDTTFFSTDVISGSAGTGLFLLYASHELKDTTYRTLAALAGKRLIESAQNSPIGMKWGTNALEPKLTPLFPRMMPNFSHGTAGIAYFLASLYRETRQHEFIDAAIKGARYLQSIAREDSGAALIFHDEPDNPQLYYLGWCHGPVGTARLFYLLHSITSNSEWMTWVTKLAEADLQSGIPEKSTPGFWNNVSQCCGTTGVAEFFLSLYRITHQQKYLDFSKRMSVNLLSRVTSDENGMRWIQAENRIQPNVRIAQTGYMQGAAGIGMWLLRLDAFEHGRRGSITLPDSPF